MFYSIVNFVNFKNSLNKKSDSVFLESLEYDVKVDIETSKIGRKNRLKKKRFPTFIIFCSPPKIRATLFI